MRAGRRATIDEVFDEVFVINVPRHTGRRARAEARFCAEGIRCTIVDAVDGETPEIRHEYERYLRRPHDHPRSHPLERQWQRKCMTSPGTLGLLLSWRRVLERALDEGLQRIVVCDDDCIFIRDFEARFAAVYPRIPPDWTILKLGASDFRITEQECDAFADAGYYEIRQRCDGSFAVGVDRAVFRPLLDRIAPLNFPFDSGALTEVCQAHPGRCFCLLPNLVIADVTESTLREGHDQRWFAAKAKWDLKLYKVDS